MKLWWHKLRHWEYWPVYVIYLPTFFLWVWYMIRFRSVKFYHQVNPSITNGGFYGDSKMKIYRLLPPGTYPKTFLVSKNSAADINDIIRLNQFHFPLIAKPDIGLRGQGVAMVKTIEELRQYAQQASSDFLIQELVLLPNEIGLFYYRFPGQKKGKISGITLKHFLTVSGNGKETIEQLLHKQFRHRMQIPKLKNQMDISQILPDGEEICLVPFGNHSRGTQFLDGNKYISPKLEKTIDGILNTIKGFYFGRLDIRYNTLEELEDGKNFTIIELNGVKSEPTHIYDPEYSFWKGQKEIFRHQMIMMEIVNKNYQKPFNDLSIAHII